MPVVMLPGREASPHRALVLLSSCLPASSVCGCSLFDYPNGCFQRFFHMLDLTNFLQADADALRRHISSLYVPPHGESGDHENISSLALLELARRQGLFTHSLVLLPVLPVLAVWLGGRSAGAQEPGAVLMPWDELFASMLVRRRQQRL